MSRRGDWYLVSSHGSVLFFVAAHPGCTASDIADSLALTARTVWGIVGDLRRAGMLNVTKSGRRHYYSVNLDARFRHPVLQGIPLRDVVGNLGDGASARVS